MNNNPHRMKWWGWGNEEIHFDLSERPSFLPYLQKKFQFKEFKEKKEFNLEKIQLPESALPETLVQEFKEIVGEDSCFTSRKERVLHSFGKSYKDLIRIRNYEIKKAPDVVLYPTQEEHIHKIFALCQKHNIALVPFGGGTSVVSGLEAEKGSCQYLASLDLTQLKKIINIDEESRLATVQAGIFGPELEAKLNAKGYRVGHFPQSFEFSTLGGWIAAKSSGQNSLGYGGIEKLVVSLRMISPKGTITTHLVPRSAEGPDLKNIIIGSEGILGVIVSATLRIHPLPKEKDYFLLAFPSFKDSVSGVRKLIQNDIFPAMIRVSDEDESEAMLALKKESANGKSNWVKKLEKAYLKFMGINIESLSFVMIGLEGEVEENQFLRHKINTILSQNQYLNLGRKPGQSWLKDRFYAPYLRDELMDKEIFVETLETATTWANLDNLYQSVRNAILNVCQQDQLPGVIYTHLSHLYPEGASLYFSIMAPIRKDDPLGQWVDIKTAANQAIIEAKGVISHHHGIGLDHKNHLYAKDSEEFHLLKNIKKTFDPKGIMNPEKLLP